MAIGRILNVCAVSMFVGLVAAHGGAHQKPLQVDPEADWATRHMAEEHHIANFDPASFFTLHDYDGNGFWDTSEILKTYGMDDPSAKDVSQEQKDKIVREIMEMFDRNGNNIVEREEWMEVVGEGKGTLPDFGLGPGHHWDMEMEYEIHHWEKYHDENTKEEDLIHPEDIAHFKLHDDLEDEADRVAALDKMPIVEQNIPQKFRRDG
ncbi:putative calcium-binding [Hyphodiscus hymeniophilus]|uniref:Calcium-binding n=1 Tax=Hyphodiscus hymeniophilus TaxID=353542 RepID=A0A9P6VE64_9HELO|nr:putative calcium-binding [Hyphodiscus hymeniophilus]